MSYWTEREIKTLGKIITGKTPPTEDLTYYFGDELFVSPKDLKFDSTYINTTETTITEKAIAKFKNQVVPRNAIMLTTLSFAFGKIGIASKDVITNQQIASIIVNDENHYRFIYYLLRVNTPFIFCYNSGIDTPMVPKSVYEKVKLLVCPLDIQKKIAAILTSYDDLIDNNRRRVAIIEKMTKEIYREWFVRYRFPDYEKIKFFKGAPEGWEEKLLPEIANITYGFPFDGNKFNSSSIGKPIIRIRNIQDSNTSDYTDQVVSDKYLIKKGDLLVGMDGIFHINHWHGEEAYLVQRSCRIKAKSEKLEGYISNAILAPIKYYESIIQGATVGHLGAKHLNSIKILIPSDKINVQILNDFINQKIKISSATNKLIQNRDKLMFRLMSGKIDVEKLDIKFPKSMIDEVRNA